MLQEHLGLLPRESSGARSIGGLIQVHLLMSIKSHAKDAKPSILKAKVFNNDKIMRIEGIRRKKKSESEKERVREENKRVRLSGQ